MHPEIGSVVLHMCACVRSAWLVKTKGEGPVLKGTRLMSSSGEVLKRVDRRCSNECGQDLHRHVHLIHGRAKAAQVYPRELAVSICEGIAAQKMTNTFPKMWHTCGSVSASVTCACPSKLVV